MEEIEKCISWEQKRVKKRNGRRKKKKKMKVIVVVTVLFHKTGQNKDSRLKEHSV
jgi:hypothetical protein